MKVNKKAVTIRGEKFEVRELLAKDLIPIWASDNEDGVMTQDQLFKLSVHVKGKPIGDEYDSLPAGVYMKLLPLVSEVNGGMFGGDEGND